MLIASTYTRTRSARFRHVLTELRRDLDATGPDPEDPDLCPFDSAETRLRSIVEGLTLMPDEDVCLDSLTANIMVTLEQLRREKHEMAHRLALAEASYPKPRTITLKRL